MIEYYRYKKFESMPETHRLPCVSKGYKEN